jgi:starch synthase
MRLNVLLLSNQVRGIDGAGGLGDVAIGLAKALLSRGDVNIRLAMPGFSDITENQKLRNRFNRTRLLRGLEGLPVPFGSDTQRVDVFEIQVPECHPAVTCYLFRCPAVFDARDPVTGRINKNSPDKAILFARTAFEFLRAYDVFQVDVLHCNDWHTGMVPVFLKTVYRDDPYLGRVATLYTTHNAGGDAYQGGFPEEGRLLPLCGLSAQQVFRGGETESLFHNDKFNFCKGGFGFADLINTVSRQYREELLLPAFGGGLDGVLKARSDDFSGVINGIDIAEWDPATDENLNGLTFSKAESAKDIRNRKKKIRRLLRDWAITDDRDSREGERPFAALKDGSVLIGVVSRIDFQKSPILLEAIERICSIQDVQVAILGSAERNDPLGMSYEETLRGMAQSYSERVLFFDGFDIPLSHLIYAAAEIFLVPSAYEPCGLTQLVAMRYGAVPIVRATGGLVDTVIDDGDQARHGSATGFRFRESLSESAVMEERTAGDMLVSRVEEALKVYRTNPARWNQLMLNGMSRDSSWSVPSMQYVKLYHEAVRRSVERTFFGPPREATESEPRPFLPPPRQKP